MVPLGMNFREFGTDPVRVPLGMNFGLLGMNFGALGMDSVTVPSDSQCEFFQHACNNIYVSINSACV